MKHIWISIVIVLFLGACGKTATVVREADDDDPAVIAVPAGDPEMEAAISEARRTLDRFILRLQEAKPGEYFFVKKPYETRSGTKEHIWVEVTEFREAKFRGRISNDPVDIPGISLGTSVEVGQNEISDWLISSETERLGEFTGEVLDKRHRHR